MLGTVAEVFGRVMDVPMVAAGLGCVWLGCGAVLRPRRTPEAIQGQRHRARTVKGGRQA